MPSQSKATLKGYFVSNATPDQPEFEDVIDSFVNLADPGTQIIQGTLSASVLSANSYNLDAITIENIGSNDLTGSNQFGTSSLHIQSFSGSFHQSGGATSYFLNNLAIGTVSSYQDNQGGLVILKDKTIGNSNHPISQSMSSSLLITSSISQLAFDSNEIHQYGSDLNITSQGDGTTNGGIIFRTGNTNTSITGSKTLYLSPSGQVGIGTLIPTASLDVVGITQIVRDSSHVTGGISFASASLDLYNPLQANTDEKGSIITFSDNFSGSSYYKTARAAIKGGTDTIGNNASGFLSFHTSPQHAVSGAIEQMRIDKDGNVGIGVLPVSGRKLLVSGSISASGLLYASASDANGTNYHTLLVDTASGLFYHTGSYGGGGGGGTTVVANPGSSGGGALSTITIDSTNYSIPGASFLLGNGGISSSLNVGIGGAHSSTHALMVYGNGLFTGDVVAYYTSDRRLKDNIKPIEDPIGKLKKIGGYSFDWNDKQNTYKGTDFGVIAQEIEEVLPSLVQTREDGYKGVKYDKIVSLLIEAIKDQQTQIDELKKLI